MSSGELGDEMWSGFRIGCIRDQLDVAMNSADIQDVSTIEVVTFSGVTSGGIVTSGTTCWTLNKI